jgi:hypothetical protein
MRTEQLSVARRLLAAAAASLALAAVARAEPYMMVREGAKCSDCHTNQTGGGKRTPFAQIHAKDILHDLEVLPIPPGVKPFNGEITPWLSMGADLRVRNSTVFEDRPSQRTGRVPENRAFRHETVSNDTQVNEFLMYLQVDLWPDLVTLYVDENFNGGATNREVFGLFRGFLPWGTYLKTGRFFPPFGLRVHDDQAYIRSRSGFTFQNPDEGGEIGIMPGPFFLATSVTNGEPGDKDVQATVNGYGVFDDLPVVRNAVAGASYARQSDRRWVAGFYGGANLWKLTYLGEFDVIDDRTVASEARRDQYAAYAEMNLLVLDWLNLRGTFDFVKVARDRDQVRYAIGAEPFIDRYIQPRIQYRINNGPPGQPELNQDELWFELHLFL